MTDLELNKLAAKIVARMMNVKTMEDWFEHVRDTEEAALKDYQDLEMTEEENAVSEVAKLMTLLNLFQDKEEYEKCAIIKRRLDAIEKILRKY